MLDTTRAAAPSTLGKTVEQRHYPGEGGLWAFVLGDMAMFLVLFCVFISYRANSVELFNQSQETLNKDLGAINTIILLISSWFVFIAVRAAKMGLGRIVTPCILIAFLCGGGFTYIKIVEWGEKVAAGISLTTNGFYEFYFILTGIHLLHLIFGMGVLIFMAVRSWRGSFAGRDVAVLESGATFWHMVDLLWIVLFPLLYLLK